jgi:TPR repeat protein
MNFLEAEKVKKTDPEAYSRLLIKAAEQGHQLALFELGWHYRKIARDLSNSHEDTKQKKQDNLKLAFECFRKAASLGLDTAQLEVGFCYKRGDGVDKDIKGAIKIFEGLSNRYPMADYELGYNYYSGEGVEKDFKNAFHHWKLAAKKSMTRAEYRVGLCYFQGLGTDKNLTEAKKYLERAANKGNKDAKNELVNINSVLTLKSSDKIDKKKNQDDHIGTVPMRNSQRTDEKKNQQCLIM